jgi:hypothetical protein
MKNANGNEKSTMDLATETIREAGASSARVGHGVTNRDLGIYGPLGAVLRACGMLGLSREVSSQAQRGPSGARQTVKQWVLSDLDGSAIGAVCFISGHGTNGDASATIFGAFERAPACFAPC